MSTTTDIVAKAAGLAQWQEPFYKDLHANPELSMVESETVSLIAERLSAFGYDVREIGGGVVGVLENGDGPTVLFRADFDALPVEEDTGLDYASTKRMKDTHGDEQPVMHACGHDVHVTCALGAAQLLAEHTDAWSGTYLALFQPGEETAEGARSMVDAGIAEALPKPDVALAQHVGASPAGYVGLTAGATMSTAISAEVIVYGDGTHGSMPHLGIDPVLLASSIVVRLQGIVSREIAPGDFGVVTVGSLVAGSKANVIPGSAKLKINFRAYSQEIRDTLTAAMERIVRAECQASNSPRDPEFSYSDDYPLTDNDEQTYERVRDAFRDHFGDDRVAEIDPVTASEDFSHVPNAFDTPYCYWMFGGYSPDEKMYPNHNPKFAPALQPTLTTGTEAAAVAVLAYLGKG